MAIILLPRTTVSRESAERVAWTDTRQTLNSDPEKAAREMARTAMMAEYLQSLTGQKTTGRPLEKPVYHLVLSWHADDKPSREHMTAAAGSALKALGMEQAQALLVAHTDGGAPHLHIVVNRVNPETGLAFTTSNDRYALSKWAKAWEREHGLTRCTGRDDRSKRPEDRRLERSGERSEQDPRAAEHQRATLPPNAAEDLAKMQREDWRDLTEAQTQARKAVWLRQRAESEALYKQQRAEMSELRARIEQEAQAARDASRADFKPLWRDQFKKQRNDERAFANMGMLQRGSFYMRKYRELSPDHRGGLLAALFNERQTMDALRRQMERDHANQRKAIAEYQNAHGRDIRAQVWESRRSDLDTLHDRHTDAREHKRAVHDIERLELVDRQDAARKDTREQQRDERRDLERRMREDAAQRGKVREEAEAKSSAENAPAYAAGSVADRFKAQALRRAEANKDRKNTDRQQGRARSKFDRERER